MKINKIICDVCEQEVDIEKDNGLAMFEYIRARQKISFERSFAPYSQMKTDKEIVKVSFDLCDKCATAVVEFIEKQKEKKSNVTKVDETKAPKTETDKKNEKSKKN